MVIVGASLAGGRAAETLRQDGYEGRIILIGEESERPYERPPLSKAVLTGDPSEVRPFLRDAAFYDDARIELRLGSRAVGLDTKNHEVRLASGETIGYERLLIATGSTPRRLKLPGSDLTGIFYLRTLADALVLRAELRFGRRVVVVGAGFIGSEIAAACRHHDLQVTVLEALPIPLAIALGPQIGDIYARIHRAHGVDLRVSTAVASFEGSGSVSGVRAADGSLFPCDFAVVGVGAVPVTDWLEGSGVGVDNGVLVDAFCQTNIPDVFAAGDVARWWHPLLGERLRVEHYENAQNQGVAAAKSMLGHPKPYAPIPFFWSDQYDLTIQYVGHIKPDDRVTLRGKPGDGPWSAFYLRDGRVVAAVAINRFKDIAAARQLIGKRAELSPAQIADESIDLRALARSLPAG